MSAQQIKAGFKQADKGTISDNWPDRNFGDLYAEPSRNGIYKTSGYHGRGVRIVNMGEMFGFEFINDQEMSRVALTSHELSSSGLIDGDLLFGRRSVVPAGAGKCALVVHPSEPLTFESSIIRVRLDKGKSEPRFYYYFFASPVGRSIVSTIIAGTNVKGIRATELKELKVPTPAKAEQAAIAEALGDADALIDALERLLAKKRDIKQGAMQDLLTGKRRLPGFDGDWVKAALGSLGVWRGGATPSMRRPEFWDGGSIPWASSADVRIGPVSTTASCITERAVKESSTSLVPADSILIVMRSGILRRFLPVGIAVRPIAINQDIKALLPHPKVASKFIFHAIVGAGDKIIGRCMKSGTTVESIELSWLKRFEIGMPPTTEEQTAIATVLSDIDAEVAALERKLVKARTVKQGMMQELLTGRTRLL